MRKIAQFGKYIRSLAIPPWTSFTVDIYGPGNDAFFSPDWIALNVKMISEKRIGEAGEGNGRGIIGDTA
jgi:hypothetical protein